MVSKKERIVKTKRFPICSFIFVKIKTFPNYGKNIGFLVYLCHNEKHEKEGTITLLSRCQNERDSTLSTMEK